MEGFDSISDILSFYTVDFDSIKCDNFDICKSCNISMDVKFNNRYICSNCGVIIDNIEVIDMSTMISDGNYNTNSNSNTQLRCIGSHSYKYQALLKNNYSYNLTQEQNIKKLLFDCNYKHNTTNQRINIAKDVLLNVAEKFKPIREYKYIYRGTILCSILAAITYYECLDLQLSHKPIEISNWFEIDTVNYSKGDKIVKSLVSRGILKVNIHHENINNNFIYRYATCLGFDSKQINFLQELMDVVSKNKILNPNAKASTKALGILYLYILTTNMNITYSELKVKFNASYGTIHNMIIDLTKKMHKMEHVFNKYNIPTIITKIKKSKNNSKSVITKKSILI
jgi:transcription initiation factor TFIIIB Brf1 subunit/transcription initiation factor TFIIB